MKQKWNNPTISELGIALTLEVEQRDPGHGYDHVEHTHICSCGEEFGTWGEALAHEQSGTNHLIGCITFS